MGVGSLLSRLGGDVIEIDRLLTIIVAPLQEGSFGHSMENSSAALCLEERTYWVGAVRGHVIPLKLVFLLRILSGDLVVRPARA